MRRPWRTLALLPGALACAAGLHAACSGPAESVAAGGGQGGSTATGAAGAGGSGTDGGPDADSGPPDPGDEPSWAPFATLVDCPIERVANAKQVRAFHWESCGPGCESAVFRPGWEVVGDNAVHGGTVVSAAGNVVVALNRAHLDKYYEVLFTTGDGWLIDAYRVEPVSPGACLVHTENTDGVRYGFVVDSGPLGHRKLATVLAPLDGSAAPMTYSYDPAPFGYGPNPSAFGSTRWVWYYYSDRLDSVSTLDGSGLVTLGQYSDLGPILAIYGPKWTGDQFLFGQVNLVDPVTVQGVLARSDGVAPSSTYLAPVDGSFYGAPDFAHSHLAFFRGIGQLDVNEFQAVELWASPYSADPAALAPYKVADWPWSAMPPETASGYGWFTAPLPDPPALTLNTLAAYDLASKARIDFQVPGGLRLYHDLGVSPGFVWYLAGPQTGGMSYFGRFALPTGN
ncbi:MAG: hypothetical protein HY908_17385 [Myxococcales bacterium]|nr:hypothetical protein [Myxococcales bacterium]